MSGGNCPETPRQKMIGMMYLMLTAMLALNVSGDLLNAYILVDKSILQSKEAIEAKNGLVYSDFEKAFVLNEAKVKDNWERAKKIREKAEELTKHIYDLKVLFVNTADGPEFTPENYQSVSNQDIAAQIMITEQNGKRSQELKDKLTEYCDLLVSYIDPQDTALINTVKNGLSVESHATKENPHASWESEKFEHIPLAASMALLSQLQSTTRNLESDVVRYLYTGIDEGSFKFNKIEPLVIQRSNYVIAGDEYYAEIMIAARDTTQPPSVNVPGREVLIDESRGVGIMKFPANNTGSFDWKGEISIMGPDGVARSYPVQESYIVAQPNVVVSAVKMNVFYEGIENPVEVSVPGVASENISIRVTNATYTKKGNQYLVKPNNNSVGTQAVVSVIAKINGREKDMGKASFRIKQVPPPVAKINKQTEGKIPKALLAAQMGIMAEMEGFDFEGVEFKVSSFKVSTVVGGFVQEYSSTSNLLTNDQKELLKAAVRGQRVVFEDIRAIGPGGARRSLGSIVLTVD
ncbi:MAG: gliding motility protein GldM [Cytophagaceae bacterium]|jgi:gliding motility-associated protein GldM|nr:gliding motility protein GldM [Cytophagaceae bacterium]